MNCTPTVTSRDCQKQSAQISYSYYWMNKKDSHANPSLPRNASHADPVCARKKPHAYRMTLSQLQTPPSARHIIRSLCNKRHPFLPYHSTMRISAPCSKASAQRSTFKRVLLRSRLAVRNSPTSLAVHDNLEAPSPNTFLFACCE